ncbi:hypothetical protein TSOC_009091 [Tetrabaena socialis]|uniref:Serine-threonine/tyrosine-protein kinase catalytic domain-containing protein n=1 Tax=Tetrabaena socialis TaxID=47790 RepID=A0A2J7ZWR1_9CHLO|nr:hypothetical protein TSOC_009091 [Tetrabaena socialis]|eukprot:PNH04713.1 hypothetical protein TSOC_009091 [Tetrabaena socialis]
MGSICCKDAGAPQAPQAASAGAAITAPQANIGKQVPAPANPPANVDGRSRGSPYSSGAGERGLDLDGPRHPEAALAAVPEASETPPDGGVPDRAAEATSAAAASAGSTLPLVGASLALGPEAPDAGAAGGDGRGPTRSPSAADVQGGADNLVGSSFSPSPSAGDVSAAASASAPTQSVRIETTRRAPHAPSGTGNDGSSTHSYSASATSSQQPGSAVGSVISSQQQQAAPGASSARGTSAAGPVPNAPDAAATAATPAKETNAGFMFGAPRMAKERRKKEKRDAGCLFSPTARRQERLENETATEELQQEMMRALDHFEKCIMFVDTSKPGWEVLYTNMAWEHVTGWARIASNRAGAGHVYAALAKHVEKVPGLELSHLLGKGGFGSVYYGTWNGKPVAVKMIDNKLTKTNTDGVSLEALMGQELSHPNIVKTIKYVMRSAHAASSASGSNSRSAAPPGGPGGHPGSNHGHGLAGGHGGSRGSHPNSRGPHPHGLVQAHAGGEGGGGGGGGGARLGLAASSASPGMMSYLTSAQQPGQAMMTSAQMMAAADLTSASAMQQMAAAHHAMVSTNVSDATTVAGGGSQQYSGALMYGGTGGGSSGTPGTLHLGMGLDRGAGRPANLIGSSLSTPAGPGPAEGGGGGGSATTSGQTAVGPASAPGSEASTAAGPPSLASGGGTPGRSGSPAHRIPSRSPSFTADAAGPDAPAPAPRAPRPANAVRSAPLALQPLPPPPLAALIPPPPAVVLRPPEAPPLTPVVPPSRAANTSGASQGPPQPGRAAASPSGLTPGQQAAAMTSRFSLAFSTITSGGDMIPPDKT